MKKKIFGGIAFVAVAAIAAFNLSINSQKNELSEIAFANVEALAGCEDTVHREGSMITVTVCNRKTSVEDVLAKVKCGTTDTKSCSFSNIG